ncbi:MAG: hypothetical protein MZV64_11405 [Ignavibacteriales bacterium]|nr:hypothetical protein [Ignavibacteriales bacterium]
MRPQQDLPMIYGGPTARVPAASQAEGVPGLHAARGESPVVKTRSLLL